MCQIFISEAESVVQKIWTPSREQKPLIYICSKNLLKKLLKYLQNLHNATKPFKMIIIPLTL